MKKWLLISFLLIQLFSVSAYAQNEIQVTARVLSVKGEPLTGAVVIDADSRNNAAIVATDGSVTIVVSDKSVLEISLLGYETLSIAAKDANGRDIVLKDDITLLEETVVVGYGTKRKESLTGSISNINSDEIVTTVHTSLSESLAGKIAGFQIRQESGEPGSYNTSINVRGFGTPLYVIDGIPSDLGGQSSSE